MIHTSCIQVSHLTHTVGNMTVLQDITCTVNFGEYIALIGQNGSGKSTFLSYLAGLTQAHKGVIHLSTIDGRQPIMGYIPQFFQRNQVVPMTAYEYISLDTRFYKDVFHRLKEHLSLEPILSSPMHALSGGELKKVLLIAELVRMPDILLLDELTAHVDEGTIEIINTCLKEMNAEYGMTIVRVTHNIHRIEQDVSRVLCISQACISSHDALLCVTDRIEHAHKHPHTIL